MSEDLNKNQEVKKKQPSKKKELTEKFHYTPEDNEQLIIDRPTEPINKKEEFMRHQMKFEKKPTVKSNKELYESYLKELKKFTLIMNGEVIYDSSIDKSKESPVKFENDFFVLYGKKYSYNGLKIQKK